MDDKKFLEALKKVEKEGQQLMASVPAMAKVAAPEMVRRGNKLAADIRHMRIAFEVSRGEGHA